MKKEQKEWIKQIPRLYLLCLIYDFAFYNPFNAIKNLSPTLGFIGIIFGAIIYLFYEYLKIPILLDISYTVVILSFFYTIATSIRKRPLYVFDIEKSSKIVNEKGLKLKDINDLEHAKAIIEYSIYMSQAAKEALEMKKYLDIAYETWFNVIKAQKNNLYLGIFKRKSSN